MAQAQKDLNALSRAATLHDRRPDPAVSVTVNGRRVLIPEHALNAGLSDLRLATEECVGMADYAEGVALVLAALERDSLLSFHT